MVKVKICGITRPQDAEAAARSGADAIGLVFARSQRSVTEEKARMILNVLPPFMTAVAVFVSASPAVISDLCTGLGIHAIQLHGREDNNMIQHLRTLLGPSFSIIKSFRPRTEADLAHLTYVPADAILLEGYSDKGPGGVGAALNLDLALKARQTDRPLILAGGLTPDNVAETVRKVKPYAIDVSSGVEEAPGIKNPGRVREFIERAKRAAL